MNRWPSAHDSDSATPGADAAGAFHVHEALFYRDSGEYVDGLRHFFAPAIAADEPVAVAVPTASRALAEQALEGVRSSKLLDMEELGRNPGRIIPAVEKMLDEHEGRMLHYVGEPIWSGRSRAEICEAVRHEALINLAWPDAQVRVLCPYDVCGLDGDVLRSAEQTHPTLVSNGKAWASPNYQSAPPPDCDRELPAPSPDAATLTIDGQKLSAVRSMAAEVGTRAGLSSERLDDLLIVASELGSNAVQHGRPPRRVSIWHAPATIVCEVRNRGAISDPLAGRRNPRPDVSRGMGLWIVHQLCRLVEVRTGESTTIRAHLDAG